MNGPNEMHVELRGADAAARGAEMAYQPNREVESRRDDRSVDGFGSPPSPMVRLNGVYVQADDVG